MERMWKRLASVCVAASVYLLVLGQSFGAGVTIITHGYQPNDDAPTWLDAMSDAIGGRIVGSSSLGNAYSKYSITLVDPEGYIVDRDSSATAENADSGEIVVCVDWSQFASINEWTGTSDIAEKIVNLITQDATFMSRPLCELPVHLIGHSRGGSVVSEISRLLGNRGIWVDQQTTLDPCPVEWFGDEFVQVYQNTVFADNFWENIALPHGASLLGAANLDLSARFANDPLSPIGDKDHSRVYDWFYGTIDLSAVGLISYPSDGNIPRNYWYTSSENGGANCGYKYSRIIGGGRPVTGLNWHFGGNTPGQSITRGTTTGSQWPNVFNLTIADDRYSGQTVPQFAIGETLSLQFQYQSYGSQAHATLYLDTDQNPYNGYSREITSSLIACPANGDSITQKTVQWNASGNTDRNYYLYAKIEDGFDHVRYIYAAKQICLAVSPPRQGNMISLVGTDWDDSDGNNNDVIETTEDIRLRLKLKSTGDLDYIMGYLSSSLGNMQITDSEVQYPPVTPGGSVWPYGSGFDMVLDLDSDYTVPFTLYVEYCYNNQDYYQTFTLSKKFYKKGSRDAAFQVIGIVVDDSLTQASYNNNDGVIQSGERVEIRPLLKNTGLSTATEIDMYLTYSGTGFTVDGATDTERYPDLSSGSQGYPDGTSSYDIRDLLRNFSGTAYLDAHIVTEQNTTETVITDAVEVNIQPAAWLRLSTTRPVDFGVVTPGSTVTYTTLVENVGCAPLQVTGIASSSSDTTWSCGAFPFTLNTGEGRELVVNINTTGMQGTISRQITVTSTGRLRKPGEDNVLTIGGLVSATVPLMTIPGTVYGDYPDISGEWIVWHERTTGAGDIWALNVGTGERRQITSDDYAQYNAFISGNLICWRDKRNNPTASHSDIYGYDLSRPDLGVFPVVVSGGMSSLIGVDNGLVAFTRDYYTFTEQSNWDEVSNLIVYRYLGNGQFTQVYNSGFTSNSSHSPMQSYYSGDGDFGGGLLVVNRHEVFWETAYITDRWESRNQRMQVINFTAGETVPRDAKTGWSDVCALSNRFLYDKEDANWDNQLFMWKNNGTVEQLTTAPDLDYGDNVFAAGGEAGAEVLVYNCGDSSRPGLYYTDRTTGTETVISTTVDADALRMDGLGLVFADFASSPYTLKYAFLKQPDIQVTSGGITFSDENPVEGQAINCTVQVRNLTGYGQAGNVSVNLFDGDPDNGGTALAGAQTFAGLSANSSKDVVFSNLVGLVEGSHTIYARVTGSSFDPGNNNTAFRTITVEDSDTQEPGINNIVVAEVAGDGDGIIGTDERLRISWTAEDASGIAGVSLTVDGFPVATQVVWYAETGPLTVGVHTGAVSVTDGDMTPETRVSSFTFNVVACERIGVSYGNTVIVNGQPLPINLGAFVLGKAVGLLPLTVRNNGSQRLDLEALTVTGPIAKQDPDSGSVAARASTVFYLTPSTGAEGVFTGTVSLVSSDLTQSPFTFKVCYEVSQPVLSVSPGNHSIGWFAASTTFSVTNQAPGTMNWTAAVVSGGDWAHVSAGASGANAGTITVACDENPIGSAERTATVRITSDGAEGSPYDVTVTQAAGPTVSKVLRLEGNLSFGSVTIGQSRTLTLTMHNDGNSPLAVGSIDCPAGFSTAPDTFFVGSNQTVTVSVTFGPDAVQTYSGVIQVNSDATSGEESLACSGTGTVVVDLAAAVDNTNLVWETGGDADWFGQVNVTHDGIDAAQSGSITNGQTSWMQATVAGSGSVSFVWKVSSGSGAGFLRFYIDNVKQDGAISGNVDWQRKTFVLPDRVCTVKWAYEQNAAGGAEADCGWVDQVVVSHGVAFEQAFVMTDGEGNSGSGAFNAVVPVFGVGPASVPVYVLPGSAGTSDYVAPSKPVTLTWAEGETGTKNVTVPIKGDTRVEGDETFYLALGTPTAGELGEITVCTVTITDDDVGTPRDQGVYVTGLPLPPDGGTVSGAKYCALNKTVKLTAKANKDWTLLRWENGLQSASRTVSGAEAAASADGGVMLCTALFKKTADLAPPAAGNPGDQTANVGVGFELALPVDSECLPTVKVSGLPAGLKYVADGVRIAGVPSKAGVYTVTFAASNPGGSAIPQSFVITVEALPVWAQGSFNGAVGIGEGAGGTATMTVSSAGKISGKIAFAGTNYSFSANSYSGMDGDGAFCLFATAKVSKASVPLEMVVFSPEITDATGIVPETLGKVEGVFATEDGWATLYRNVWKDEGMPDVMAAYAGYYTAAVTGGEDYGSGYLAFTVGQNGSVKMAGKLADGTTMSCSGSLILDEDGRVWTVLYTAPKTYNGGCFFAVAEFLIQNDGAVIVQLIDGLSAWTSLNPQATGVYGDGFERFPDLRGGWYSKTESLYAYFAEGVVVDGVQAPALAVNVKYTDWDEADNKVTWSEPGYVDAVTDALPNGILLSLNTAGNGFAVPGADQPATGGEAGEYDYLSDSNGDGQNNTSGLSFKFTRSTGLFSGAFKVWFDYASAEDFTTESQTRAHTYKTAKYEGILTPVCGEGGAAGAGFFLWADTGAYEKTPGKTTSYKYNRSYDVLLRSE